MLQQEGRVTENEVHLEVVDSIAPPTTIYAAIPSAAVVTVSLFFLIAPRA